MVPSTQQVSQTLSHAKDWLALGESVFKIGGIFIGGIWSYNLFWKKRQVFPRAELRLAHETYRLSRKLLLLRVTAELKNIGEVLVELETGYVNLELLAPGDKTFNDSLITRAAEVSTEKHELISPLLLKRSLICNKPCEIEPGESQHLQFDFILERNKYRLLKAKAYLTNAKKRKRAIGWDAQKIIELPIKASSVIKSGELYGE